MTISKFTVREKRDGTIERVLVSASTLIVAKRVRGPNGKPTSLARWNTFTDEGVSLVEGSERPFLDSARAMMALGFDPVTKITMQIEGVQHASFNLVELHIAADLHVKETDNTSARFVPYQPHPLAAPIGKPESDPAPTTGGQRAWPIGFDRDVADRP